MIDRGTLNAARIEAIARSLEEIAALADPVGAVIAEWERPNGLSIQRVRTPIGVVGVDLREPAERHRRCRRALPEGRQRGHPARRLRYASELGRDPCLSR